MTADARAGEASFSPAVIDRRYSRSLSIANLAEKGLFERSFDFAPQGGASLRMTDFL
jgi:hypothetical protein